MRDLLTGHAPSTLIGIGHRTGLFDAAARGPATGAERAGCHERAAGPHWRCSPRPGSTM
jgi:hypothetical protein